MVELASAAAEPFTWTEARVAILRERWNDPDWSATRMGAELGCTRNTVLGKAYRLKLGKRRVAPKAAPHVPPKRRPVPPAASPLPAPTRPNGAEPAASEPVSLLALRDRHCRFIAVSWRVGEVPPPEAPIFCGADVVRTVRNGQPHLSSWCTHHAARCCSAVRERAA